jgi:hypothetical protein
VIMTTLLSSLAIVFVLLVRHYGAPLQRPPQAPSADLLGAASEGKAANAPLSVLAAIAISTSFTGGGAPSSGPAEPPLGIFAEADPATR